MLKYKWVKFNNRFELQYLGVAVCSIIILGYVNSKYPSFLQPMQVFASTLDPYEKADKAGAKIIKLGQYGIKKLSIAVVFYGLFLQLLKKDDTGKKLAVGAGITYVMSLLVPAIYDLLDDIFM